MFARTPGSEIVALAPGLERAILEIQVYVIRAGTPETGVYRGCVASLDADKPPKVVALAALPDPRVELAGQP